MFGQFFKRLFGVPRALREELESEGIQLLEEGVGVRLNYWKYRSRRARFGRKSHGFVGFVALTDARFVGSGYSRDYVSLPFVNLSSNNLKVEVDDHSLILDFDVSDFHEDRSGRMKCRYRTAKARQIAKRLKDAMAG